MRRSFAVRLAVAFAAVGLSAAAVTALLVNVAFSSRFTNYLEQRQDERRARLVTMLEEAYNRPGGWDPPELERITAGELMDGGSLRLENTAGEVVWESQADPTAELHRQMMGTGPLSERRRVPVEADGELVGDAVVRLPQAGVLREDVAFRASVNRMVLVGALTAGFAALLLGLALATRVTAPARALTRTARAVAVGERSARVAATRSDEFGEMARAFNRMADALVAEDRLRREFAADVAHELRTPLMILRGEIEAIQDGMAASTPEAMASLRDETLRLGRLIDDLDTLARADAAGFSLDRRPTDIVSVAAEAATDLEPVLTERSLHVETTGRPELVAMVDPLRVKQIVANLLSNVAKFTPRDGRVRLSVDRDGADAVVAVWNSGPGIADEDLPHIFDRFYRGGRLRVGGSGIGLTVARDLARAHDGSVDVTSTPSDGTTFWLRLPLRHRELHAAGAGATHGRETRDD